MRKKVKVGAVIYDPKVTIIWEMISKFLTEQGIETSCEFYKDYELQVTALLNREIDIAWNSPLAWLDSYIQTKGTCLNGSMRDTDQNRKTYFVVRKNSTISSLLDLKGKAIGFGAEDSPQARLIPINHLHQKGLEYNKDYVEKRFDIGIGLHGDHIGGELDAVQALVRGEVDAAVTIDLNWNSWTKDGTIDSQQLKIIEQTRLFDHCIFVGHPDFDKELFEQWNNILLSMDYNLPNHKEIMDLEGLEQWVPGRLTGFSQIEQANQYLDFLLNSKKG